MIAEHKLWVPIAIAVGVAALFTLLILRRREGESEGKAVRLDRGSLVMVLLFLLCIPVFILTEGDRLLWLPRPIFVFLRMASIVGFLGVLAYFIGESVPRRLYHADRFPFKPFAWEKNGRIYEKMGIRWRKAHGIDITRFMKRSVPKQITLTRDPEHMKRLVQEMCNAELVHWVLTLMSPVFAILIDGCYGIVISILYAVSNLSDVTIQRYNRPRIQLILERLER